MEFEDEVLRRQHQSAGDRDRPRTQIHRAILAGDENLRNHGFIGAEPFLNGVATALGHIRDKHLANVRLWRGDALEVLQRVPDGALSFIYLLHPDPWPKARHAKRRMSAPTVLFLLERLLERGLPDKVLMTAFGPGFTCAGLVLEAA